MTTRRQLSCKALTAERWARHCAAKNLLRYVLAAVFVLVSIPPPCHGQATGTIEGVVADQSGAAVPEADITVTNQATNQIRKVVADRAGEFTVTLLPSGTYSVLAVKAGFASSLQKNILLSANTTVQANTKLKIASVSQQVDVTDTPSLIQTTSTTLVQVVDTRRIEDLPLNGRNVLSLMEINAGVSTAGASGETSQIQNLGTAVTASVNGARGDETNFLLDDSDNIDYFAKVALPFPNPDGVREFSIQTSTYDARYGRAGGVVNVITKSGGNTVRGSLFEYVRNYDMNASNYFSGRDTLKRNQFGGSIGAPFYIPKLYNGHDRTFVFFSYQGTRLSTSTPAAVYTSPDAAMAQGNFAEWLKPTTAHPLTGVIINPLTGLPFPGNQIPVTQFDPVAVKMLALMPQSTAANNYQVRLQTPTTINNDNEFLGRIDHQLTPNQHLFGRIYEYLQNEPWGFSQTNLYSVVAGQKASVQNLAINHSWVISSKWLNQANFTRNITESNSLTPAGLVARSLQGYGAKVMVLPSEPTLSLTITGWTGASIGQGYTQTQINYEGTDLVSYSNGKHNLRMGVDYRRYYLDKTAPFNSGGTVTFTGQLYSYSGQNNSGNSFAQFLLGKDSTWAQQSSWSEDLTNNYFAPFVQDDWRISPRLTVNIGLRWDPQTDYQEHLDRKGGTFIPGMQSVRFPNAPVGLLFLGDPQIKDSVVQPDRNNFAPRVGFAFSAMPKTVIRGAYGIFYDLTDAEVNNRVGAGEPFVHQISLVGPVQLSDPYSGGPELDPTPSTPTSSFIFDPYSTFAVPAKSMPTSYLQDWNLIIEHQVADVLLRIGYVGSKGTHLLQGAPINPGIYGPGATTANLNARRIYQPIGSLILASNGAWSNYNSLQVTVEKRWGHGFSILGNYTWSKSMDSSSGANGNDATTGPNPFNYTVNYGLSDFDVRHRLVVSGLWELPKLTGHSTFVREVVGGWQNNYIFSAHSGVPLTVVSGGDNALAGLTGEFADVTGKPFRLSGDRTKAQRIASWFNTAAFMANAVGTFGNSGRNIITTPGAWNLDYSIFKTFPIKGRLNLQFRAEAFNVFNHANLGAPNATFNSAVFGKISAAADPRILQLALRMSF